MGNGLFSNLLVAGILFALFAIIYCKIQNKTITDLYHEIKDIMIPQNE